MSIEISTDDRIDVIDVTDRIEAALPEMERGTCTVFVEHTTAALSLTSSPR
jgi:thiamine phosphate synthase YjbQ (UPF0047 family)